MIDAVIFDWGGTLSEYVAVDLLDLWRVTARILAPDRAEEVAAALVEAEAAWWERVTTSGGSGTTAELLRAVALRTGLDADAALHDEAVAAQLDAWTPHVRHDPDAVPVLTALRERGLRLALLSNTHWPRAWHEHFLARDGLVGLLDAEIYTSELAHTKPHAEAFRAALEAVGVDDPARAVFVGDRPLDDIAGARRAGLRAVLRPNRHVPAYDVTPDAVIHRLPELLDLVAGW